MKYDLWFARDSTGQLWISVAEAGEGPTQPPAQTSSVNKVYRNIRQRNLEINQVGVCNFEMIRIDEI